MGTSSWDPSRAAIAEVLITSHGFALLLLTARRGEAMRAYSKPWLVIKTSAVAALDGSHELVCVGPPEPKEPQRDGLLCPERRSGRASTRADQSDRSGLKPALLAPTAHTTSNTTTERSYTTISKVTRVCFRALGPTVPYSGSIGYIRLRRVHSGYSVHTAHPAAASAIPTQLSLRAAREAHRPPTDVQVPPRARARSAVEVAVHAQASGGTSMASEGRTGDACKAR